MPVYAAHLRKIIQKGIDHPENYERPLEGFKIILDAGNGSGGFLATDVLAPLGADTTGTDHAITYGTCMNEKPSHMPKFCVAPCTAAVRGRRAGHGAHVSDTTLAE